MPATVYAPSMEKGAPCQSGRRRGEESTWRHREPPTLPCAGHAPAREGERARSCNVVASRRPVGAERTPLRSRRRRWTGAARHPQSELPMRGRLCRAVHKKALLEHMLQSTTVSVERKIHELPSDTHKRSTAVLNGSSSARRCCVLRIYATNTAAQRSMPNRTEQNCTSSFER